MDNFAKLYNNEEVGQVLVVMMTDENHNPCVDVMFKPEGLGVCKYYIYPKDHLSEEKKWEYIENVFDSITEEKAVNQAKSVIEALENY